MTYWRTRLTSQRRHAHSQASIPPHCRGILATAAVTYHEPSDDRPPPIRISAARRGGAEVKVVLFCGGYGMRMRDDVDDVPKPMQMIGDRPLLWNVMRYYAHFGHREFILCLGYGARHVIDYFRNYDETRSNDFVLRKGGRQVKLLHSDISDDRKSVV